MRWERCGVEQPCLGDQLLEFVEEVVAEFAAPEWVKATVPKEGEKEFFFEDGFGRWSELQLAMESFLGKSIGHGDILPVK